jgi:Protein of unknown function (DUF3570)
MIKMAPIAAVVRSIFAANPVKKGAQVQNKIGNSAALQALLLSAFALPGMVGTAMAAPEDLVQETTLKLKRPSLDDLMPMGEDQEAGVQYTHYAESQRIDQTNNPMPPIRSDGVHAYSKFRLNDSTRIGFDFVEDVWSGASPLATVPSAFATSTRASVAASYSGYFSSKGQPVNNPLTSGYPATPNTQIVHAMGYASPETRTQGSFKYGYDWNDKSVDLGIGMTEEVDFMARFGSVGYKQDLNNKNTTVNMGLSYTYGNTHAIWNKDPIVSMNTDAYPGQFTSTVPAGVMWNKGVPGTMTSPVIGGNRYDTALTGGVTQVLGKNDLASSGFGYTHTTGFLSNPWKGAVVFSPQTADPNVLAVSPGLSLYGGAIQLEHRPSLRNQFTWDSSYLHYFERLNAASQLHYSLFADSWGVRANTVDVEWRQGIKGGWILTPKLRYYSQSAASFYAPYFFASSTSILPKFYFSSDERLAAFGTVSPGLTLSKRLDRGVKLEMGVDYYKKSGSLRLGGNGVGSFADLTSYTVSIALVKSLDAPPHESNEEQASWIIPENKKYTGGTSSFVRPERMAADVILGRGIGIDRIADDRTAVGSSASTILAMADDGKPGHSGTGILADAGMEHMEGMEGMEGMDHMNNMEHRGMDMGHQHHMHHMDSPIGVMGADMMDQPGDFMTSYIFEQDRTGGTYYKGSQQLNITGSNVMAISGMTMDMQMLELMYAQNKWLNWMVMAQLLGDQMNMMMYEHVSGSMAGMVKRMRPYMSGGGVGDTTVSALIRLWDAPNHHIHLNQGVSIPTGSVKMQDEGGLIPYDMQNGSGTWDYKPGITYTGSSGKWIWGAQGNRTIRPNSRNASGYTLGNEGDVTVWGGYKLLSWLTGTLREAYSTQGPIRGSAAVGSNSGSGIAAPPPTDANTANYGGTFRDLGVGFSASLGTSGPYSNDRVAIEYLKPTGNNYYNGEQPNHLSKLLFSAKFMF